MVSVLLEAYVNLSIVPPKRSNTSSIGSYEAKDIECGNDSSGACRFAILDRFLFHSIIIDSIGLNKNLFSGETSSCIVFDGVLVNAVSEGKDSQ